MAIRRDGYRYSQLAGCIAAVTDTYPLTKAEARDIIDHQVDVIRSEWDEAAEVARLTAPERDQLWGRQILNPYTFENAASDQSESLVGRPGLRSHRASNGARTGPPTTQPSPRTTPTHDPDVGEGTDVLRYRT